MKLPADIPLVPATIAARTADDPDAVAIVADGDAWTYGHLADCAAQVARVVREAGAGPGQVIGLACPRSFEGVAGLLGILSAGAAFAYLDATLPARRLAHIVAECRMPLILTAGDTPVVGHRGGARVELDEVLAAGCSGPPPPAASSPSDLCYVVYTSGSTGVPKGVAVEHGGVANMAHQLARIFGVGPGSRMLQFSAWSWDAAICELLVALTAGATVVLAPEHVRSGGEELAGFLRAQRITVATLVPSLLAALPYHNLPDLHTLVAVGEPCPPEVVERWAPGRRFLNGYGPTEATVAVSVGQCRPGEPVTIGSPLPGVTVRVVDPDGADVAVGQPGELLVGGAGVARGYLATNAEEATDPGGPGVASGDPFSFDDAGRRWYRTGDIVRQDPAGRLVFEQRLDDQVQVHGHRIEPGEIAATLRAHSTLRACAVVQVGGRLVAFVDLDDDTVGAAELSEVAASWLPPHMMPEIQVVMQWPLTIDGKVDVAALIDLVRTGGPNGGNNTAEVGPLAEVLGLVREALKMAQVGPDDDIFDAGGHSLLAPQLAVALAGSFGVAVETREIIENPTARQLARLVAAPALAGQGR